MIEETPTCLQPAFGKASLPAVATFGEGKAEDVYLSADRNNHHANSMPCMPVVHFGTQACDLKK